MSFAFAPSCCCGSCQVFNWNLFQKYPESPVAFLSAIHRIGASGWSIVGGTFPAYSGTGDVVYICDAGSPTFGAEIVLNGLPNLSDVRWLVNLPSSGISDSGTCAATLITSTVGTGEASVASLTQSFTNNSPSIIGYAMCSVSVVVFKQPLCEQWVMSLIWNMRGIGPNTCPGLQVPGMAGGSGGALITTVIVDDGTGGFNDLSNNAGGYSPHDPFPTCGIDNCSTVVSMVIPKPTRNGVGLILAGSTPIQIQGLAVARPTPPGFYNTSNAEFDTDDNCVGFPQDCGCSHCTMYVTLSGFEYVGAPPCVASAINGSFALQSTKGFATGQAGPGTLGNNTNVWALHLGTHLTPGDPGGDCCFDIALQITYDPSTGYTSFGLGVTFSMPSPGPPPSCPGIPVQVLGVAYADNVGQDSVTYGRKSCDGFVDIVMTWDGVSPGSDWNLSAAQAVITGSDGESCIASTCDGSDPIEPSGCSYTIKVTMVWDGCLDFDLYVADYGTPSTSGAYEDTCWYENLTATGSLGTLTLNQDAQCDNLTTCETGSATPEEIILGAYTASDSFAVWYYYFADCDGEDETCFDTAPVEIEITNTGTESICVNGTTVLAGESTTFLGPLAAAGTVCDGETHNPNYVGVNRTLVTVTCGACE